MRAYDVANGMRQRQRMSYPSGGWSIAAAAVAAASIVAILIGAPATAGESQFNLDLGLGLPPPADTGKPSVVMPPAELAPEPKDCVPALPCGSRMIGEIRKNGAVELQVPALRW
jgi:hypothetical protein